ncbi:Protein ALP1-like [Chionoecetes opilio]|uniref:Protein ALP1-like n=1 Tax=Chionoecetes opilio TaxID=41210 RepID=A0A8J4YME3_CHIOP|nr:Protein ALP1-like [Chionoecetes opilio]
MVVHPAVLAQLILDEEDYHRRIAAARARRRKRIWSRQLLIERPLRGEFRMLMEREKAIDPASFHGAYRMTPDTFDELLELVRPRIEVQSTHLRESIGAAERLGLTLRMPKVAQNSCWKSLGREDRKLASLNVAPEPAGKGEGAGKDGCRYLATGTSQKDIARYFCVGRSTVCSIIPQVCRAVWEALLPLYMPRPTQETWRRIAEGFWQHCNFPQCLGAIDGKHIHIQNPVLGGSQCFNYKRYFSTVLMAIADSTHRFVYVDVGAYGKEHDGSIFSQSRFARELQAGSLNLPEAEETELPYVFAADEAYHLKPNMLRPYPARSLNHTKSIFNYRLSRTRRVVENTFGILVTRWSILRQPIIARPEKIDAIVQAMCILHNFLRDKEGLEPESALLEGTAFHDFESRQGAGRHTEAAAAIRDKFAEYFVTPEGRLAGQENIVHRGQANP